MAPSAARFTRFERYRERDNSLPKLCEGVEVRETSQPSRGKVALRKCPFNPKESNPGLPCKVRVSYRVAHEQHTVRRKSVCAHHILDLGAFVESIMVTNVSIQ